MRELDTSSPVVWPSWCYSGIGDLGPKHRSRMNGPSPTTGSTAIDILNNNSTTNNNNSSASTGAGTNNSGAVKAERFSPPTGDNNSTSSRSGTPVSSYEGGTGGGGVALGDRGGSPLSLSLSHQNRERDPLKAMEQATSRNYSDFMRSLAAKYNHTNPNDYFSGAGAAGPPGRNGFPPGPDPRSGFGAFKAGTATPFVGLMAPLATAAANTAATAASNSLQGAAAAKESGAAESTKANDIAAAVTDATANNRWSFGANPFAAPGPPVYPTGIDMSSTQALINMVRTASAQSANQLETYLKGIKRGAENPLDLSATKKARKSGAGLSLSESLYGDALLGLPMLSALNRASKELLPTSHRLQTKSPKPTKALQNHTRNNHSSVTSHATNSSATNSNVTNSPVTNHVTNRPQCLSLCSDKPCVSGLSNSGGSSVTAESAFSENGSSSASEISTWSVEDVASFVASIDICAEYAGNFRDQRIDGSALPLLTEQHLTTALQMKLGPALKLRAVLSRRLGHCAVCMHCVHCHGTQASLAAGLSPQALLSTGPHGTQASLGTGLSPQALLTTAPPSSPSPKPLTRPSSTGN